MKHFLFTILIATPFICHCQVWKNWSSCIRNYSEVHSFYEKNDTLMVGGVLTYYNGITTSVMHIALWDSLQWDSIKIGTNGKNIYGLSFAIQAFNNQIYVGNNHSDYDDSLMNYIVHWDGINWLPVGNIGAPDGQVYCLQTFHNKLYAGGEFYTIGNEHFWSVASWDDTAWSDLAGGVMCGCILRVYVMAVYNNELIVGGAFTQAGGITAYNIAAWDGVQWHPVGGGLDGPVQALVVDTIENVLYAGGVFYNAYNTDSTVYARKLAKWDGTEWSHIGTVSDCDVHSLCMYHGDLYAGGCFTLVDSVPVNYIARWNGVKWDSLGCGVYGDVTALYVYKDELYVGGGLLTAGCDSAYGIARWYMPPDTATEIAKVNPDINREHNAKCKIYPNPAKDSFTVETSLLANEKGLLKIYNVKGELYRKFVMEPGKSNIEINTTGWQHGTHLCVLEINGVRVAGEKIVINQ